MSCGLVLKGVCFESLQVHQGKCPPLPEGFAGGTEGSSSQNLTRDVVCLIRNSFDSRGAIRILVRVLLEGGVVGGWVVGGGGGEGCVGVGVGGGVGGGGGVLEGEVVRVE